MRTSVAATEENSEFSNTARHQDPGEFITVLLRALREEMQCEEEEGRMVAAEGARFSRLFTLEILPIRGQINLSKVLCFQEGDQLWHSASGNIMTSQPDYDSEQQRSEAAVSSEQSVGEQKVGEQKVGEQEVAINKNNSDEEQLPDIEFVATTKARSTVMDGALEMVGQKERELGRMLNKHEE